MNKLFTGKTLGKKYAVAVTSEAFSVRAEATLMVADANDNVQYSILRGYSKVMDAKEMRDDLLQEYRLDMRR